MNDGATGWCPDHAICMDWIDRRAAQLVENFQEADYVYMSEDIYAQFEKRMRANQRYLQSTTTMGPITHVITSVGTLSLKRVPHLVNFCHVGTHASYDYLVRVQVDQMFEDTVLKDCERE